MFSSLPNYDKSPKKNNVWPGLLIGKQLVFVTASSLGTVLAVVERRWRIGCIPCMCRPVARGGGSGGSYDPPPQLPIPKILFHPLAILFHPLAILFHLSAILFHPLAILFHPSAILFHPLAILFHPSAILFHPLAILFHPSAILFHPLAILFHPWNMWMTSHGQCPRGGVLANVQEWGRFSN